MPIETPAILQTVIVTNKAILVCAILQTVMVGPVAADDDLRSPTQGVLPDDEQGVTAQGFFAQGA